MTTRCVDCLENVAGNLPEEKARWICKIFFKMDL